MDISNKKLIYEFRERFEQADWAKIMTDLLACEAMKLTVLETFTLTSKSALGRIKKDGVQPKFFTGIRLLGLHAELCGEKQKEAPFKAIIKGDILDDDQIKQIAEKINDECN